MQAFLSELEDMDIYDKLEQSVDSNPHDTQYTTLSRTLAYRFALP